MTVYSSDISDKARMEKTAFGYFLAALFCALFGAVYEVFSHEVYSFYMLYAFGFPLVGGTLPFWVLARGSGKCCPGVAACSLYHAGIAALTVGSFVRGILDIYGTTNRLTAVYFIAGALLTVVGGLVFLFEGIRRKIVKG